MIYKTILLFFYSLSALASWQYNSFDPVPEVSFLSDFQKGRPALLYTPSIFQDYPRRLDWSSYAGPVVYQGHCNSCVAFASVATLETLVSLKEGRQIDLSEQFVWSCGAKRTCPQGWSPTSAVIFLSSKGTVSEFCMPYESVEGKDIECSQRCASWEDEIVKIESYKQISGHFVLKLDEVVAALQDGPILGKMTVYEDFKYYKSGIYEHLSGKRLGGHSVSIMGYDLDEGYFIAKNSWGTQWGEGGYFRIKITDESGLGAGSYQFTLKQ